MTHKHTGQDEPQIEYEDLSILSESAIANVSGTADATYSSNEQTLINDQTAAINFILAALRNKRIIKQ